MVLCVLDFSGPVYLTMDIVGIVGRALRALLTLGLSVGVVKLCVPSRRR